jgi:hypothetical protein
MSKLIYDDPEFQQFWALYPRKLAKGDARKAWRQTAPIRPPLPELLAAVELARREWAGRDVRYIPHAATWLRAERWSDEYSVDTGPDTTSAWQDFREAIRGNKPLPPQLAKIAAMFGGTYKLGEMQSVQIDKLRQAFDKAYMAGSH